MRLELPEGWELRPLVEVATLQRGFDLPIQDRRPGPVPVYGSNGIDGLHDQAMVSGPGVVTGRSGTIGRVYFEPAEFWPLNTTLYVRDFHGNEPKFVARLLESLDLLRFAASTGVPSLNRNFVHPEIVRLPPVNEQGEIAGALELVDGAIERADALITKLEQVRAGLQLDLLTPSSGMDEDWTVIRIGDVCEHITKGATPTTFGFDWVDDGVLFLRSECVTEDGTSLVGSQRISPQAHAVMARSAVRGGDLLMTITGYIGRTCRYPVDWPEANINQHIARIRIRDRDALAPEFALWALKHPAVLRALELEVTGLAYPQIGLTQVQNIRIHVPRLERQMEIAAALDSQQAELKACEAQLAKLWAIKRGLSEDLLSGRVRTAPELELA